VKDGYVPTLQFPLKSFWAPLVALLVSVGTIVGVWQSKVLLPSVAQQTQVQIRDFEEQHNRHVHPGAAREKWVEDKFEVLFERISPLATEESLDVIKTKLDTAIRDIDRVGARVQRLEMSDG